MTIDKKTLRFLFAGAAGCILLFWLLHEHDRVAALWNGFWTVLSPFAVGGGLAFVLNVPMRGIESRLTRLKNLRFRRSAAILLTFLAVVLAVTGVVLLVIPQIVQSVRSLIPDILAFAEKAEEAIDGFLKNNPELLRWLQENTDLESVDWSGLIGQALGVLGDSLAAVFSGALTAIGSIAGAAVNLVISVVFGICCLARKEILARQGRRLLYAFLPESFCDETVRILRLTCATFSDFLSGQCLEVCILGILFAVTMALLRMPYIPLISLLVAVTAFIPIVGAFVGCILGAFFILVDDPVLAVWFVVMFLILQQVENNLIYPRVVGRSIGLPGMWILLAVAAGGAILGAAGMFLMIPVASVLYTLLGETAERRLGHRGIDPDKLENQPPLRCRRN